MPNTPESDTYYVTHCSLSLLIPRGVQLDANARLGQWPIESPFWQGQWQWQSLFSDSKSSLAFCLAFSSLASISDCTRGSRRCYFDHSLGQFIRFWLSTNPVNVLSLDPTSQLIEINWFPVTRFVCRIRNGTAHEGAKCQSNNAII